MLNGKRITIIGLAREGAALARFLASLGALVTISDRKPPEALAAAVEALAPHGIRFALGDHPEEILDCDYFFISPGVPLDSPIVREAMRRGLTVSGESRFFLENCPASVIGITGSSGKTTTTHLTAEMLKASGFRTWVGGNIGSPLTPHLTEIQPDDQVVMELSSFQLQIAQSSPHIAAILNITANHLDRHASMEEYIEAKANILRFQSAGDAAVLGHDNPVTRGLASRIKGRAASFSLTTEVAEGAFMRSGQLILRLDGRECVIGHEREVQLRGRHNLENILASCAVAGLAGAQSEAMTEVAVTFRGVEHRLELVRELDGVRYYNDSIATSPERAAAALRSFTEPVVLLAGGQDKHLPWEDLARLMLERTRAVVTFGQAAGIVEKALAEAQVEAQAEARPTITRAASLAEAVSMAQQLAQPGDVVLLSPGGTSYDAFTDFVERGEIFKRLVREL